MKTASHLFIRALQKTLLASAILLAPGAAAEAGIVVHDTAWGQSCNNSKSFSVKMRNTGSSPKDFRLCLQKSHGGWGCYTNLNTGPGEVYPTSWGFMVCDGTGRYKFWERDTGSKTPFGNP
ncbi:hypothetical protein ACVNHC_18630 [Pannonibacter sp. Q-1]